MGPLSRYLTGEYTITCNLNWFQTNSVNVCGSSKPTSVNRFSQTCSKLVSVWTPWYSHPAAIHELFTRHLLTSEECSEVARKGRRWENHLAQVLSTKPAEVVQEASQVLEKHGCPVKKLKSELCYTSTLWQLDSGTCTNWMDCFDVRKSPLI